MRRAFFSVGALSLLLGTSLVVVGAGPALAVAAPTISTISPTSGPIGTVITVTGAHLSDATSVTLGGHFVIYSVVSATEIKATVVPGSPSGALRVATPGGTAKSPMPFTVVSVNWPQFHRDPAHGGYDPSERWLTVSSVPTMTKQWDFTTGGGILQAPVAGGKTVYVASNDDAIYAVNVDMHLKRWSFTMAGPAASAAAVSKGVVYAKSTDGTLYALKASDGTKLWSRNTGSSGEGYSSPAVRNGAIYIGSGTGGIVDSSPAVANGYVYVGSADDNLYALTVPVII